MSRGNDSAEKTQAPTARRLRDARRDGQVARSADASATLVLAVAAAIVAFAADAAARAVATLALQVWTQAASLSGVNITTALLWTTAQTLAAVSLALVTAIAAAGAAADFMQVGPLWVAKRIAPDLQRLNPADGLKRLVSMHNLIEAGKAILKTLLLLPLLWLLLRDALPDLLRLPRTDAASVATVLRATLAGLLGWTAALFVLVSLGDMLFQRWLHRRELRMSLQDVRREHRQDEGDPQLKGQRRRLQRQWARQDAVQAVKRANALVVNPTHIAVALQFDAKTISVPLVSAKGEGPEARRMREAAVAAGVPVVRNVALARALEAQVEVDEAVPEGLFDAVAEVLAWAQQVRDRMQADNVAR
jgi:type III secretion protein U